MKGNKNVSLLLVVATMFALTSGCHENSGNVGIKHDASAKPLMTKVGTNHDASAKPLKKISHNNQRMAVEKKDDDKKTTVENIDEVIKQQFSGETGVFHGSQQNDGKLIFTKLFQGEFYGLDGTYLDPDPTRDIYPRSEHNKLQSVTTFFYSNSQKYAPVDAKVDVDGNNSFVLVALYNDLDIGGFQLREVRLADLIDRKDYDYNTDSWSVNHIRNFVILNTTIAIKPTILDANLKLYKFDIINYQPNSGRCYILYHNNRDSWGPFCIK